MRLPDSYFEGKDKILDLGGWFKPEVRATHVVDIMPWETRGAKVSLERLPSERFSKDTWFQADFLNPTFKLPFDDKSFDAVICGHTVEDLASPENLLREMQRVGKAGAIECPSRLAEQTLGLRDRMCNFPGHPHHHWIVDSAEGKLLLYSKQAGYPCSRLQLVPLKSFETYCKSHPEAQLVTHYWSGELSYRFIALTDCVERAQQFVRQLDISNTERLVDGAFRMARRIKARIKGTSKEDFSWWKDIVELSRPYSTIPLKS
jgi:hypothetical protein